MGSVNWNFIYEGTEWWPCELYKYLRLSLYVQGYYVQQSHNIKLANKSLKIVEMYMYLRTTLTNKRLLHKEI